MTNVRKVDRDVIMSTNAGQKGLERKGDWKEWGQTYLEPIALTNIVSISDTIKKGFRVLFDSDKENCFSS